MSVFGIQELITLLRGDNSMSKSNENVSRREFGKKMVSAATLGLFVGLTASAARAEKKGRAEDTGDEKGDKHACKGLNECKGKGGCKSGDAGCKGKNTCKGKGGCSTTEKHSCKGNNSCKGEGGCKSGDKGCAGKNTCKGKGGCHVPVKAAK